MVQTASSAAIVRMNRAEFVETLGESRRLAAR